MLLIRVPARFLLANAERETEREREREEKFSDGCAYRLYVPVDCILCSFCL